MLLQCDIGVVDKEEKQGKTSLHHGGQLETIVIAAKSLET
jgi:hypothetical protein